MSYSEFFNICLTDKEFGYYMNSNVFNKEGDFITSPELSQLFSEMIAIWHVMVWEKDQSLNQPKIVMELGPGTGNLTKVLINTFLQLGAIKNIEFHLVEVSPFMRQLQ